MPGRQTAVAIPLLNSYAHSYLGLSLGQVGIAGDQRGGQWLLMLATPTGVEEAEDFDATKAIIGRFNASIMNGRNNGG